MRYLIIGALILLATACGSVVGPTPDQRRSIQFTQNITLIGVLPDYEVYEMDIKGGTCYIARGYQSVGIHCKED